ncbi:hypothetical protein HMF7854_01375 [Sphingomonas ginkgonis]|uniref:Putative auto-transporter adhesin head GIN domain-containing protein n=1 Tax=Sphingomonas ginkgonis TaxID=2315330 RepID=A0A3R9Y3W4_9SPHN|nr:DUF2807 domain-containing protein [Sphingomonas ginkgonis]RST29626.1 hypothetical protein HMF7854_01375 [Sphingomonas ginkgonis]
MRRLLPLVVLAATLAAAPAAAAVRSFTVTGFDRVRIDGPYRVSLVTGVSPFARASGNSAALDGVTVEVQGTTLYVRPNPSAYGGYPGEYRGPVEISVGTHDLGQLWINGSGSADVQRVGGLKFNLSVQGSGSASIAAADVDQLVVGIAGTASARMGGKARSANIYVRGTSSFDGRGLATTDSRVVAEGPATVALQVVNSAKVNALGASVVSLSGHPACELHVEGSATVEGCKAR